MNFQTWLSLVFGETDICIIRGFLEIELNVAYLPEVA